MRLIQLYLRLDTEERNKWNDDFSGFYLRNQDKYPAYQNRASSDMQQKFRKHIDFMETAIEEFSKNGNIRHKVMYGDKQITDLVETYLLEKYNSRREYLEEYLPECLI